MNSVKKEGGASMGDDQPEQDIGDIELDGDTFKKVSVWGLLHLLYSTLPSLVQCKSLLRPVKKSLFNLTPSEELSTQETLEHYKKVDCMSLSFSLPLSFPLSLPP